MAIIKGPAFSLQASGNVGGICYSRWRGLAIARSAWSGGKSPTPLQLQMRDYMTTVSRAWSGVLIESERQSWRAAAQSETMYSRIGIRYVPTGYNYFVQINYQLLRRGLELKKLPPIAMDPNGIVYFSATWSATSMAVELMTDLLVWPGGPKLKWESWQAGPYDGGGRHALPGEYRFDVYYDDFGQQFVPGLVAFKYYWFKARWNHNSGRVGNWFEDQVYVES